MCHSLYGTYVALYGFLLDMQRACGGGTWYVSGLHMRLQSTLTRTLRCSALRLGKQFFVIGIHFWVRLDVRLCSQTRSVAIELITALLH